MVFHALLFNINFAISDATEIIRIIAPKARKGNIKDSMYFLKNNIITSITPQINVEYDAILYQN
jgi:hypothetical protein